MLCCTKTVISFGHMRKEDVDFKCNIIENPINMLIPRQEDTAQNLFFYAALKSLVTVQCCKYFIVNANFFTFFGLVLCKINLI